MRTGLVLVVLSSLMTSQALADDGATLFQQNCSACHTIGEGAQVGPDLHGVTERRERAWLTRWISDPDDMLAERDPVAIELLGQYNQIQMPDLGVTPEQAELLIDYIEATSATRSPAPVNPTPQSQGTGSIHLEGIPLYALGIFLVLTAVIVSVFVMIVRSTRDPVPTIDMKAAYRIRKVFFFSAAFVVAGLLALTLTRTPYPDARQTPDRLVYVAARQFNFVFSSEPITSAEDLARVTTLGSMELEAGSFVEFRVTSLDVTHAFGIYDSNGNVVAQTQAMPGYVNRLRVRFPEQGRFNILCLEYCGTGHHVMRSSFAVR